MAVEALETPVATFWPDSPFCKAAILERKQRHHLFWHVRKGQPSFLRKLKGCHILRKEGHVPKDAASFLLCIITLLQEQPFLL